MIIAGVIIVSDKQTFNCSKSFFFAGLIAPKVVSNKKKYR